jgi:hypothetical protein
MSNTQDLEKLTRSFFEQYWNDGHIGSPPPKWRSWHLDGVPSEAQMAGCYAIYAEDALLYICVAVTEGKNYQRKGKRYGLLKRLERHVLRKHSRGSTLYVPMTKENKSHWQGITSIRLIGFPDEHRHLAAALEIFLINRLDTVVNAQARWRNEA